MYVQHCQYGVNKNCSVKSETSESTQALERVTVAPPDIAQVARMTEDSGEALGSDTGVSQAHRHAEEREVRDQESNEDADQEQCARDEKLKKLGNFCHSLGLQPKRMTDKMLSTIEMSKDIERDQRNVISKLNSAASTGPRDEEEDEDEDMGNPDDDDTSIVQVDENNEFTSINSKTKKIAELSSSSKSLKRRRIPPPLSINDSSDSAMCSNSSTSSATTKSNNYSTYPKSAPANVPNFPSSTFQNRQDFVGKPRVQYLGKVPNGMSRHQHNGYKLKTPFVPCFARLPPPPLQQQQPQGDAIPPLPLTAMASQYPYYPYMYPIYQPPAYSTPAMARSAVPYSLQAQYYQENEPVKRKYQNSQNQNKVLTKRPKQPKVCSEELQEKNKSVDNDERKNSESEQPTNTNSDPGDECEPSEIAIEDGTPTGTRDVPSSPIMGEIRILRNVFSFEFPVNESSVDKKMFLSICNSVWDKSEELGKANR